MIWAHKNIYLKFYKMSTAHGQNCKPSDEMIYGIYVCSTYVYFTGVYVYALMKVHCVTKPYLHNK